MLLGALPGLITTVLVVAAWVVLLWNIFELSAAVTWFADGWADGLRATVRVLAGIVLVGLSVWLSIVLFTALTLIIGDPFYEAISARVDREAGVGEVEAGVWRSLWRSVGDALRLAGKSLLVGVLLFLVGLVPVVGPVVAAVLGVFVGGWFLAVELTAYAFNRRGVRYRRYRRVLGERRGLALGFGTPVFLLFMIPLGPVLVMPAAVAGATMLVQRLDPTPADSPLSTSFPMAPH